MCVPQFTRGRTRPGANRTCRRSAEEIGRRGTCASSIRIINDHRRNRHAPWHPGTGCSSGSACWAPPGSARPSAAAPRAAPCDAPGVVALARARQLDGVRRHRGPLAPDAPRLARPCHKHGCKGVCERNMRGVPECQCHPLGSIVKSASAGTGRERARNDNPQEQPCPSRRPRPAPSWGLGGTQRPADCPRGPTNEPRRAKIPHAHRLLALQNRGAVAGCEER